MVGFDIFKTNKTGILLFPHKKNCGPNKYISKPKMEIILCSISVPVI